MRQSKVLILGGSGLLGRELTKHFQRASGIMWAPSSSEVSLLDRRSMTSGIRRFEPDIVVNCAAYTNVDGAEANADLAWSINADAVEILTGLALERQFRLIQISTASVFSGRRNQFFSVNSQRCPINIYNESKAQGEVFCEQAMAQGVNLAWIRTYWLYGGLRKSFADLVVEKLSAGLQLQVVSDQWGQPTYARDLALMVAEVAKNTSIAGPVHGVNSGVASRLDWAHAIAQHLQLDLDLIEPVTASAFSAPAPRPVACLLSEPEVELDLAPLRHWREALFDYLDANRLSAHH